MARLECKCGQMLSNSTNPEIQYKIFSDDEWIRTLDRSEKEELVNIAEDTLEAWKCGSCERLYIFKIGQDLPIRIYRLD